MDRRRFLTLTAAGVLSVGEAPAGAAVTTAPDPLLHRWFRDTYRSMLAMTTDFGIAADTLRLAEQADPVPSPHTSPTNIGCGIWSTVAAHGLGVIDMPTMLDRVFHAVHAVEQLKRAHGFWLNWYDAHTGEVLTEWPGTGNPVRPFLSSVDNAWLVTGLSIAAHAAPALAQRITPLLRDVDWSFFYTPYDPLDPVGHPGQLRGGYWTDTKTFTSHHYGALNTEPRMASYLGIAAGSLPSEHYWRLHRTLPPGQEQEQEPDGAYDDVDGVTVWQGHYTHRGRKLVPTWGGSMFEALMVPLFVPESEWSPSAWGVTHRRYVRSQIEHGLDEAGYGYWGFSPANVPEGGYQEYGVDAIGMLANGYASNTDRTYTTHGEPLPPPSAFTNGVVTPHAVALALPYARAECLANLTSLGRNFGAYREGLGFHDSINVQTGRVSDYMLALDQGMIAAALAQELSPGLLQRPFRADGFHSQVRPLLTRERFGL